MCGDVTQKQTSGIAGNGFVALKLREEGRREVLTVVVVCPSHTNLDVKKCWKCCFLAGVYEASCLLIAWVRVVLVVMGEVDNHHTLLMVTL